MSCSGTRDWAEMLGGSLVIQALPGRFRSSPARRWAPPCLRWVSRARRGEASALQVQGPGDPRKPPLYRRHQLSPADTMKGWASAGPFVQQVGPEPTGRLSSGTSAPVPLPLQALSHPSPEG